MRRYAGLVWVRTNAMNTFVKSYWSSAQSLEGHRAGNICHSYESLSTMQSKTTNCDHRLRSIQESKSFLDLELQAFHFGALQCVGAWQTLSLIKRFTFANHC